MSFFNYSKTDALFEQCLGYTFTNKEYLVQALTSKSFPKNFGPLAQFGDPIVKLFLVEYGWKANIRTPAQLTRFKEKLECRTALSIFFDWFLDEYNIEPEALLRLNKGEILQKQYKSILGEFLEAVIGAVYLDGGCKEALRVTEYLLHFYTKEREKNL